MRSLRAHADGEQARERDEDTGDRCGPFHDHRSVKRARRRNTTLTNMSVTINIARDIHIRGGMSLKTVQMTLEPELVAEVDRAARRLGLTRSAFTRRALRSAIDRIRVDTLERRHRKGYRRKPIRRGEFDIFTSEQTWPD